MKRRLFILAILVISFLMVSSGTIAYYTFEDKAHNVITTGGVKIAIEEFTKNEDGLAPFPEEGIKNVYPGATASKIVNVKNIGESNAWIRVWIEYYIEDASGTKKLPLNVDGTDIPIATIKLLDGWYEEGGYYYYTKQLQPGETTSNIFEEVYFDVLMDNAYQSSTTNIIVHAQAVQTDNNGSTVGEAKGWPMVIKSLAKSN